MLDNPGFKLVNQAKFAVYTVFFGLGFTFANWASRFPAVRDLLDYSPSDMGRLLLVGAIGSMLALPLSGWFIERFGPRRVLRVAAILFAFGYFVMALALGNGPMWMVYCGLFIGGFGMGTSDTAINFQGAYVERLIQRSIMPRFHGAFSLGTMGGALTGAGMALLGVPVGWHIGAVVILAFVPMFLATFRFIDVAKDQEPHAESVTYPKPSMAREWLSGRSWLLGLVVLAAALTEGAANDWLALGVVDGFGTSDGVGAFGLFVFLSAMTAARFAGTHVLDRFGRVVVLRASAVFSILGLVAFATSPFLWLALLGAALWGIGASLGFPVGMSAASDDPKLAAARLSVVSTIGYTAFFAGPPLLGELAAHIGYREAMLVILVPAAVGMIVASAAREQTSEGVSAPLESRTHSATD